MVLQTGFRLWIALMVLSLPLMAAVAWAGLLPDKRLLSPAAPTYGQVVALIDNYQRLVLAPDTVPTLASYERFVGSGAELEVTMELQACRLAGILPHETTPPDTISAVAYNRCAQAIRPPSGAYDLSARSWYLTWVKSRMPYPLTRAKVLEVAEVHPRSGFPPYAVATVVFGGGTVRFQHMVSEADANIFGVLRIGFEASRADDGALRAAWVTRHWHEMIVR